MYRGHAHSALPQLYFFLHVHRLPALAHQRPLALPLPFLHPPHPIHANRLSRARLHSPSGCLHRRNALLSLRSAVPHPLPDPLPLPPTPRAPLQRNPLLCTQYPRLLSPRRPPANHPLSRLPPPRRRPAALPPP